MEIFKDFVSIVFNFVLELVFLIPRVVSILLFSFLDYAKRRVSTRTGRHTKSTTPGPSRVLVE